MPNTNRGALKQFNVNVKNFRVRWKKIEVVCKYRFVTNVVKTNAVASINSSTAAESISVEMDSADLISLPATVTAPPSVQSEDRYSSNGGGGLHMLTSASAHQLKSSSSEDHHHPVAATSQ